MRSEPRSLLRENQNKEKENCWKIASSEIFYCKDSSQQEIERVSVSFDELSNILHHRFLLKEATIEVFLEKSCRFYETQIILFNTVFLMTSRDIANRTN